MKNSFFIRQEIEYTRAVGGKIIPIYIGNTASDLARELGIMDIQGVHLDNEPTKEQIEDAIFAWKVVKYAKTNSAVIARDFKTVAISQGQTNAIVAVEQALNYACDNSKEAVLASDATIHAEDCIYSAVQGRISLIIQPGGSVKDQKIIETCDKYGIAMITTGIRNYKQ